MLPLIDTFLQVAGATPAHIAVKDHGTFINYGQLLHQINVLAYSLKKYKLSKGDRVAILLPNSIEYIIAYYASWRVGLVPVALNTLASQREIEFWLKDSDCKLLFSNRDKNIIMGIIQCKISYSTDNLTINGEIIVKAPAEVEFSSVSLDDVATIIYTSGTTGSPKGITLLQRNFTVNNNAIIKSLNITDKDDFLCVLPFFYSFGNSILHTHLVSGATLVLLNQLMYPMEILKTIQLEKCSGFAGVPSLYISLLKKTNFRQYDLSSLRYMTQAGGPLASHFIAEIHDLLPNIEFVVMYGQTEATARISYLPAKYLEHKTGSVGIAVDGLSISVVDEDGVECKRLEKGEICVQGENIMAGYWGNVEATRQVLINNRLHTGDTGYMDQDGFLYIVGRQSELLKISEHRVSPYEIEEVLLLHDAVEECAVIGCSHQHMGQSVRAFIVSNGSEINEMQLKKFCKQYLSGYKIPKEIMFVDSLPKTSSGKIKRNQLSC